MLQLKGLTMHYGQKVLFDDVDLLLQPGNRYGIVGANGSGKSTFLRIIAGQEKPSSGEFELANQKTIGFLKQDQFRYENDRIVDVVLQGNQALWKAMQEKEAIFAKPELTEEDGFRLAELEEIVAHEDGYVADGFARNLLSGLGIRDDYHDQPLHALSGGFKLRALLAQVLFQKPDVLLLDEPTNHLDIISIHWLKNYLCEQFKGLLLFISHDRDFLNGLSTHILDVDYGTMIDYVGNYDKFLAEKEEVHDRQVRERKNTEKKIAEIQANVDRFRAKASKAKQAQSRQKMVDRMVENELNDVKSSSRIAPYFRFVQKRPSGKQVLLMEGIGKAFAENTVLDKVSFSLQRGEKVAVIGSNGMGKSTLLKIALDLLPADQGKHEWGYESQVAYFAQDHHEQLKEDMRMFDWLKQQAQQKDEQEVRKALGQMLFSGDTVEKNILNLSGGEAARLLMANIILQQPNVLILDEPTNHLDLETVSSLAEALKRYEGTVIFVSHDRYFVDKFATRIIAIKPGVVTDYPGTYQEYLAKYGEEFFGHYS